MVSAFYTHVARATCSSPTANVGSLDFQGGAFKYCDGTNWQALGGTSFPLTGPNGTATGPTYSFSAGTDTGMYSTGAGTIAFTTFGTQRLTIDSSGKVGVGTTTPVGQLELYNSVGGTISVRSGNTFANMTSLFQGADPNGRVWQIGTVTGGPNLEITHFYNQPIVFKPNNSEMVRVTSSGLGIGTQTINNKLDVAGGVALGAYAGTLSPSNGLIVSGNVGIGTISPSTSLDVRGGAISAGSQSSTVGGEVRFSATGSAAPNYVAFRAPATMSANTTWVLPPTDGSSSQVLQTNGAGSLSWASQAAGTSWVVKSANYTAVAGDRLMVDTSAGAVSITLPAAPTIGQTVYIMDVSGSFDVNNLTVLRNGNKIMSLAEDMTVDLKYVSFELVYSNATYGWRIN